jgi:hypothetical protein
LLIRRREGEGGDGERLRAKEEYAWCLARVGDLEDGVRKLKVVLGRMEEGEENNGVGIRIRRGVCGGWGRAIGEWVVRFFFAAPEIGVLISLGQTHLDQGLVEFKDG